MDSLIELEKLFFKPLSIAVSCLRVEKESKEYQAAQFTINGAVVIYRKAKQTPKKVGQFVTCWKRNSEGITVPYHEKDDFGFYFIQVNSEAQHGLFIFPKKILIKHGIIETKNKAGKRGFRVYPFWDKPISKQALKTQHWQLDYVIDLEKLDSNKMEDILNSSNIV